MEFKETNPKDKIGCNKLPIGSVPSTCEMFSALAFLEGQCKYGRYNWRVAGVSADIYYDAMKRHMMKWWNGQDHDPKTHVPHLASVIACASIILDAQICGKLNDTRPPASPELVELIDRLSDRVVELKELFKDHHPHQHTILDGQGGVQ
jgi:Domain of unknown function (DUF5664)